MSLADANVRSVAVLERSAQDERSRIDRAVDVVTSFSGSLSFVWLHSAWFLAWIALHLLFGFDRGYGALTMIVSLEAIYLSTFVLITENRQARLADRRAHLDLQVNRLAEQESTKTLELLTVVLGRLGADVSGDQELAAMLHRSDPGEIADRIADDIEE